MLKHRILSGVALLAALILAAYFMPVIGLFVICVLVAFFGQREFYRLAGQGGVLVSRVAGLAGGVLLLTAFFAGSVQAAQGPAGGPPWEILALTLVVLLVFTWQFPQKHNPRPLETLGVTLMGVLYVPLLMGFMLRLGLEPGMAGWWQPMSAEGRLQLFFLVAVVKAGDTGAYFAGRAWGRRKLFPRISPAKTWEGLLGGCALAVLVGVVFWWLTADAFHRHLMGVGDAAVLALVLTLVGVVGDMFESLIKRAVSSKDSSAAIPGMGGLLDVLDSLLFAAPVLYTYALLFM